MAITDWTSGSAVNNTIGKTWSDWGSNPQKPSPKSNEI
jgi:hypothetical protein